jgi:restriction endonuclease S subunit
MSTTEPVDALESTDAYPKYDEYEDSGVEWLGEIPSRWTVAKLKYCIESLVSGATPKSTEDEYWASDEEEGVPWVAVGDMSETSSVDDTEKRVTKEGIDEADLETLPKGTLLYSIYASLGEVAVLGIPATTNQAILGITPDGDLISRDFLYYWLRHMRRHVEVLSSSNTQDNLSAGRVRNMPVYLPEVQEQRTIAKFLDRETERIDALIEKKEELIDLLEEKRTALISRVVTKGLNRDVEMQDSGVEWIGEIPAHWETAKVWMLFELGRGRVISSGEIKDNSGKYPVYSSQTEDEGAMGYIDTYDFEGKYITWTTDGANAGTVFLREGKFNCTNVCGTLNSLYPHNKEEFFSYALDAITNQFVRHDINPKLMNNVMSRIEVQVPPVEEQKEIYRYLDRENRKVDEMIEKAQDMIALLEEYRTALISAAVTGQIDVREEVPAAPAE